MSTIGATHTGYGMVDVIGNEDLLPDEGFAFKPVNKRTTNYETSLTFPLNTTINGRVASRTSELKPPTPVQDRPLPKTRAHRSKLIAQSTLETRKKQLEYNEKMKEYQLAVKAEEDQYGFDQLAIVNSELQKTQKAKAQQTRLLADVYKQQFAEKEARRLREIQEQKKYETQLREEDEKFKKEDAARREKELQISRERRAEFEAKNAELLKARQTRHAKELEEEAHLRKEAAEIDARKEARAAEDERRRLAKTKIRTRVVDQQAAALEKKQQQTTHSESAAQSEADKNVELEQKRIEEKKRTMEAERHSEWLHLQKERDLKRKSGLKKPFPGAVQTNFVQFGAADEKLEEESRKQAQLDLRRKQEQQINAKRQREEREKQETLEFEKQMLSQKQEEFNQKIQNLQSLVPPELGIKVPQYTVKSTFSS